MTQRVVTDLMSRSLFHRIKAYTWHAWLNLQSELALLAGSTR